MTRKLLAALLCGSALFACACSDNVHTSSGSSDASLVFSTEETQGLDSLPDSFGSVKLESPVLHYLGSSDITQRTDTARAVELYEQTYAQDNAGGSSEGNSSQTDDGVIIVELIGSGSISDALTERIQSDNSPDLVDKQNITFPYLMSKNTYEDLTPYMDMSAPQWLGLKEYVDRYEYNGKHFFYPWSIDASPRFLIYNRTLLEQYGIPDPAAQWEDKDWTWETFLSACASFAEGSGGTAAGICGDQIADGFVASSGIQLIGRDDSGKFVNNLSNPDVTRTVEWLGENLRDTGLSAAIGGDEGISAVAEGKAAFLSAESSALERLRELYPECDAFLVPFPCDPEADEYYYRTVAFGYLVPKGAKNVQGACCFINCCRLSLTDEKMAQEARTAALREQNLSGEQYDFICRFRRAEDFSAVIDENYCFDTEGCTALGKMLQSAVLSDPDAPASWEEQVRGNDQLFGKAIEEFNSLIE